MGETYSSPERGYFRFSIKAIMNEARFYVANQQAAAMAAKKFEFFPQKNSL